MENSINEKVQIAELQAEIDWLWERLDDAHNRELNLVRIGAHVDQEQIDAKAQEDKLAWYKEENERCNRVFDHFVSIGRESMAKKETAKTKKKLLKWKPGGQK